MYATCEPDADGSWPCSFDHPGGHDEEPLGGAGKKAGIVTKGQKGAKAF